MIIRVLPSLANQPQWIAFCRREAPYCFVEEPDCLVDFQSNHLVITLLNQQVRNGKDAIKYSIGSRSSVESAWNFIKGCRFDLTFMVRGLEGLEFTGNARDNSGFGSLPDVSIRKFFAKEKAVISPAFLGPLDPLPRFPPFWDLHSACRLLANDQLRDLRNDTPTLPGQARRRGALSVPATDALLLALVEHPQRWKVQQRQGRLYVYRGRDAVFSLIPDLKLDLPLLNHSA